MNRPLILIAALGVTAAVVGAVVALVVPGDDPAPRSTPSAVASPATRSSARSSTGTPSATPSGPQDELRAKVPGDHVAFVPDPDTAATWDDQGHVEFWDYTQSGWQKQGSSTFPPLLDGTLEVTGYPLGRDAVGPDRATVVVYVVAGQFTTDAGNGVLVYGPGRNGWGALEDDGTLLVSHGRGASVEGGTGLFEQVSIGADAASRTLTTGVCPQELPRYQCGDGTAVQSQWRWDSANQRLASISR